MIGIINGSPKTGENASGMLIEALLPLLNGEDTVVFCTKNAKVSELADKICQCDTLLFVFPLYVDSFPSHVLRLMTELEAHGFKNPDTRVFCLVNNGFYESSLNTVVLDQMRAFTEAAGLSWGMGVGVSAGELHRSLKKLPFARWPQKDLGKALELLAKNILQHTTAQDIYVQPSCSHSVWKWLGTNFLWYKEARKNGLRKKEMYRRLDTSKPICQPSKIASEEAKKSQIG